MKHLGQELYGTIPNISHAWGENDPSVTEIQQKLVLYSNCKTSFCMCEFKNVLRSRSLCFPFNLPFFTVIEATVSVWPKCIFEGQLWKAHLKNVPLPFGRGGIILSEKKKYLLAPSLQTQQSIILLLILNCANPQEEEERNMLIHAWEEVPLSHRGEKSSLAVFSEIIF